MPSCVESAANRIVNIEIIELLVVFIAREPTQARMPLVKIPPVNNGVPSPTPRDNFTVHQRKARELGIGYTRRIIGLIRGHGVAPQQGALTRGLRYYP